MYYSVNMPDKYSMMPRYFKVIQSDFNFVLLLLTPFWLAMIFINAKVMIEINREWGIDERYQQTERLTRNTQ